MNNKGKMSGLALIIILVVAVIIAWLFMTQMKNLASGGADKKLQEQTQEDLVNQAQQAVDALNQKTEEAVQE